MNSREEQGGQGEECRDQSGAESSCVLESEKEKEKWRKALVGMGQEKEKEGGQERSGQIYT